jgi:transcriptional regulator with XRE-family HTH domain
MDTVGERIKAAINAKGLKQNYIADKLGIDVSSIGNYIAGRRTPSKEILEKIAELTGVSVAWLKTGIEQYLTEPASPTLTKVQEHQAVFTIQNIPMQLTAKEAELIQVIRSIPTFSVNLLIAFIKDMRG